jgi:mRNA-degrading endonuclease RelE of RelBE toxin-antitoxin system
MFRIFTTKEFDDNFNKLDGSNKKIVRKIMEQLKNQGSNVGKPLGRSYFKEKKFGNKRLYFLVYENYTIILAVGISDKKAQQPTINKIVSEIENYKEFIIKRLKDID